MTLFREPFKLQPLTFFAACAFLMTLFLGAPQLAHSEVIKLGISKQGGANQNIDRPKLGMDKDQVKSLFGTPSAATQPTGNPPIAQWKYTDFTVYFEGDHVIHSVIHPSKPVTSDDAQQ